ncbi:diphosphate--fructose-6-phosphate 1-phosphotransferase [Chlamydia muridarum str. Nigg]|jgi:diphosphate--fructose-6-phosphate 1-phosphotransferase|uniref:Probable ATP-dependent 6-phosphofructokinase n=2 Tax=Chlamydia muridarum TaxID=83560 RepID=A0A069ZQI1_CHLMR|nr:diphosphate--fructose-6-phosphate 1-phosphotransferase [Chlamydia muridarum]UFW99732.1 diphosphate--fructose-6-phosphate 1-phosphotransferase [Chlamydia trachomatis]AAF39323.1 pyrophosphate--fructose 6-phosphate 1-phosphotransferase, beta subunit [Chlamydia muridarum str. Nigg]AHH22863.1 diphosphate--fructose-6-phosphate 1-phosphotransferase [Chlamydia muridarum str. Nigg3 CMUT3-5]AHH23788.1 diphosphate--fructose-6-phosphate 1-phosphotransferase [Chlamydia muridarum str. Nigg CM972]AID37998
MSSSKHSSLCQKTPPLCRELQKAPALLLTEDTRFSALLNDRVETVAQLFPCTYESPYRKFIPKSDLPLDIAPLKVGVMLSGGPAPGGHNVILGLLHSIKKLHPHSKLLGFIRNGHGLLNNNTVEITEEFMKEFRNSGGFNCIGTGRTNIITEENKARCLQTANQLDLDGLVIIGGDGSNTATAILAEYFAKHRAKTVLIGVPKTIDGDLQHLFLDLTFGFDTATKFYSSIISNISRDALSCKGHYHFIKLMGRSSSHITLECALQTHPNMALIGEEIAEKGTSLSALIQGICEMISDRAAMGKYHGVILIPEGVIEFIPEIQTLVKEIESFPEQTDLSQALSPSSQQLLHQFPEDIRHQLLYNRDAHGNVYVSQISVDKLLIHLVQNHLETHFKHVPFNAISHFLGYEGRSGTPTHFDNVYSYNLGYGAGILVFNRCNGYLTTIEGLTNPIEKWRLRALPIVRMLTTKTNKDGTLYPLIKKGLVDISSPVFNKFSLYRKIWALEDSYRFVGPLQIHSPEDSHSDDFPPLILFLNHNEWQKRCSICLEIPDQDY